MIIKKIKSLVTRVTDCIFVWIIHIVYKDLD
jgi:hypothetical protein